MRYFKEHDENGRLIAIGAGDALNGEEITIDEYEALLIEIEQIAECANLVYRGEMALEEVPENWQTEVRLQVEERIERDGPYDPEEISDDEAIDIITGVSE